MPRYDIVVMLNPPSLFGLPDEGWLVFGSESRDLRSVAIDPRTQNVVGHGTLSRYRAYDDRLLAKLTLNTLQLDIEDNFVRLSLDASGPDSAIHLMTQEMTRFCVLASILIGEFLTFEIVQIVEDGTAVDLGVSTPLLHGRRYNLETLRGKLTEASSLLEGLPSDRTLDQALRYFGDAGSLYDLMTDERRVRLVIPLCFLQFWKAITTIVGDPSADRDHQTRYRQFGIGQGDNGYFNRVLKPLHTIRDRFDVAHVASLDAPAFATGSDLMRCRSVAQEVIKAYAIHLRRAS